MAEAIQISSDFTLSGSDDDAILLIDASGSNLNLYLPHSLEAHKFSIKRVDEELTDIVLHARGQDRIEGEAAPYHLRSDFSRITLISSREGDWWVLTDGIAEGDIETLHFQEIFNLSSISTATPGVASADAMSYFGMLNVARNTIISNAHLHRIQAAGSGETVIELWKGSGFSGPTTLVGSASLAASDGDFAAASMVFTGGVDRRRIQKGQYLFAQLIDKETTGAPRGFTFDVHFTGSR